MQPDDPKATPTSITQFWMGRIIVEAAARAVVAERERITRALEAKIEVIGRCVIEPDEDFEPGEGYCVTHECIAFDGQCDDGPVELLGILAIVNPEAER